MVIAKVVDEMVSTQKQDHLFGQKLLVVQPVELDGSDWGDEVLRSMGRTRALETESSWCRTAMLQCTSSGASTFLSKPPSSA